MTIEDINSRYLAKAIKFITRHNFYGAGICFNRYQENLVLANYRELYKFRLNLENMLPTVQEEYPFIKPYTQELTNSEIKRLRYGRSLITEIQHSKLYPKLKNFGPRWSLSFYLYFKILPDKVKTYVHDFLFHTFTIHLIPDSRLLYAFLKELSTIAKQLNSHFSQYWMYLVNLETFGLHVDGAFTQRDKDDIIKWVQTDYPKHYDNNDTDGKKYHTLLRHEILNLNNCFIRNKNAVPRSVSDFLKDINKYCLSGTTFLPIHVRVGDERPRKTKGAAFLGMTEYQLSEIITNFSPLHAKAIPKLETGKIRYVIVADERSYLQMTYISDYFEQLIAHNDQSTLFMAQEQIHLMKIQLCKLLANGTYGMLPLDQSEFDHQPSMDDIIACLDLIDSMLPERFEYHHVLSILKRELIYGTQIHLPDNSVITHKKGILSGWRWTALIDTLINIATFNLVVHYIVDNIDMNFYPVMFNAQGDDDLIVLDNTQWCLLMVKIYEQFGIKVNIKKFFISSDYHEYLRIVYSKSGSKGYPARSIVSLLINSPINADPPAGFSRARQQATNWYIAMNRGCVVKPDMIRDISKGNSLSPEETELWLHTPACVGGFGAYPESDTWLAISDGFWEYSGSLHNVKLNVPIDKYSYPLLRPMLQTIKNKEFHPSEKQFVKNFEPLKLSRYNLTNIPLQARFVETNSFTRNYQIAKMIDERRWNDIIAYMTPETQNIGRKIYSKCSRWVFVSWVQGKLPYHMPNVYHWAQADLSVIWQELARQIFASVLFLRRVNRLTIMRSALLCEQLIHRYNLDYDFAR